MYNLIGLQYQYHPLGLEWIVPFGFLGPGSVFFGVSLQNGQEVIKMDGVQRILNRADLLQYTSKFDLLGYDSAQHLLSMGPSDLEVLQQKLGMKAGHVHRLKSVLSEMNYETHVVNAGPPADPPAGPDAGPAAGPAAATTGELSEAPKAMDPKMTGLKDRYVTWTEAKLASYQHSTKLGFRALVDRKKMVVTEG